MGWSIGSIAMALSFAGWLIEGCGPDTDRSGDEAIAGMLASGAGGQAGTSNAAQDMGTSAGAHSEAGTGGAAGHDAVSGTGAASGAAAPADAGAHAGDTAGNAGTVADSGMPEADSSSAAPRLPPVDSVESDGPFETAQDLSSGPGGNSGVFYPTELGKDGLKHPIFVWGCGGTATPDVYAEHMNRIASHGFVAIAVISNIGDDGDVLKANLDWLAAENDRADSIFFGKLDPDAVGAGGHSIGSVNTFLIANDPRILTTLYVAGGSLDDVNDPNGPTTGMGGKALTRPAALISAETDIFGNVEKLQKDFDAAATAPIFFTKITGADHVSAARDGLGLMVAWLRWQVAGETERSGAFLDPAGEFRSGKYVSQIKNW